MKNLDLCIFDTGFNRKQPLLARHVAMKFSKVIAKSPFKILATDAYTAVTCSGVIIPYVSINPQTNKITLEWVHNQRHLFVRVGFDGVFSSVTVDRNPKYEFLSNSSMETVLFHSGLYLLGESRGKAKTG